MQKKSVFYKIMRILYPYKNALWALRPAKPLGVLSRHPCRNPKPLPRGEGAILLGLPPLDQARMLAVSHTKPLHDAVAQMADDLYGGYAPATPFLSSLEVFRQSGQCSCTDKVTKILMPCRYRKCFKWCWRYILLYSFNNNGFFGRHTRTPPTYHRGSSCLLIEGMYINFRCT